MCVEAWGVAWWSDPARCWGDVGVEVWGCGAAWRVVYGVAWCGVVRRGVVWCGAVRCGAGLLPN